MIRRIDLRTPPGSARGADGHHDRSHDRSRSFRAVVPRAATDVAATVEVVQPILDAVRTRGIEAVLELSRRFDRVEQTDIVVPVAALRRALEVLDPAVRAALEESVTRLRATCEAELEDDVTTQVVPGGTVTQRQVPIERVGLYVPGGVAPLVASVVMNVGPAQGAGVSSIALTASPQARNGGVPPPPSPAAARVL